MFHVQGLLLYNRQLRLQLAASYEGLFLRKALTDVSPNVTCLLTGVEEQLQLLEQVVTCMQSAVTACQLAADWAQPAQQLQQAVAALKAVVATANTSAGR